MSDTTRTIAQLMQEGGQIRARRSASLGHAIANIGQTIGNIPAQIQQRQAQGAQNELRLLQVQNERSELADKEKARAKRAQVEAVLSRFDNIDDAIPEVFKVDPEAGMALSKHVSQAKSEGLKFRQELIKTDTLKAGYLASQLGDVKDQGDYTKKLYTLKQAMPDFDWSRLTGALDADAPAIADIVKSSMSAKEQADLKMKAIDDERAELTRRQSESHQEFMQRLNAANVAADNKRADAQLGISAGQLKLAQQREQREAAGGGADRNPTTASLALAAAKGDESAAAALKLIRQQGAPGGVKLTGAQQEDLATMLTVSDLATETEALGAEIGWKGVGGMGTGSIAQFAAKNLGGGTTKEQELRNKIGNIKATIAKLRGGTSFTPNEQTLLDTYTPTIDDGDKQIQAKLKSLKEFIVTKRKNTLKVAAGDFENEPLFDEEWVKDKNGRWVKKGSQ